ncbi:Non-specific serine/threonine protein kinase [Micromonospora saelicesensis]|uniref:non-specific serine/threonine protein kinase n=1 Tax=Micromonospora saelicesensis TaxID=285676 RepID=A0A328NXI0_9ACTN|nr:serine/threonine-protein kinase [Micromonospora saelicesensis]RAO36796.1 Non-specific serine/threonine protein kinase [Micromonospora saelicesensis]
MSEGLRPGDPAHLGGYEVLDRLGDGGMGSVFLARSPQGRLVAVKVVRADLSHDEEFRGRFRSEVNRARQVPPFCTAEVLDADPDHDPPYLVVEYVEGPSLAEVVRTQGPLGAARLHSIAVGVATALTAIHGAGVIHRDLKPANVLVAPGGIKVIDFGIARAFEATSQHTRTNQMVGTVSYMAPERFDTASSRPAGPAADIFAWGALVAYAATGRSPFGGDSATATAMRILTQPPDLTGLGGPLRELVSRALEKDPAARPTARELLDGLLTTASPEGAPAQLLRATPPSVSSAAGGDDQVALSTPSGLATAGREGSRGRGWVTALGATAAVIAVLVPAFLFGPHLLNGLSKPDRAGSTPSGSATTSGPAATTSTPASGKPSASSSASADPTQAMLAGQRRILLHVVEIDRDLSLPSHGEVEVGNGTGKDALFVLEPVGVDYMIKSVNPEIAHRPCLGVKLDSQGYKSLVGADCRPTKATLFAIDRDGKDDKGRPSYAIISDEYGPVQWSPTKREIFVEFLGDAPLITTFSLVDRGAV